MPEWVSGGRRRLELIDPAVGMESSFVALVVVAAKDAIYNVLEDGVLGEHPS